MENNTKLVDFYNHCYRCKHKFSELEEEPCSECLDVPARESSHTPIKFVDDGSNKKHGYYSKIKKLKPYLYEVNYIDLDFQFAKDYFKNNGEVNLGACSSVVKGHWYGRNLDWTYDDSAEFVVRTPRLFDNFASIGVAGGIKQLTEEFVSSGEESDLYKLVPFMMQDGINEYGVVTNMNVVPLEKHIVANEDKYERVLKDSINGLMLVRYILDNYISARQAAIDIKNYIKIEFTDSIHQFGYELHYMVSDIHATYIIEVGSNGIPIVIDVTDKPYMTNFFINGVIFNEDGTVYTPATQDSEHNAIDTNHITPNGSGLERYNYICENWDDARGKVGMRQLMTDLFYTKSYSTSPNPSDPYWYTEFVGSRGLTVASSVEDYEPVVDIAGGYFTDRSRDDGGKTWHTVHSSVYDMDYQKLYLVTQEDTEHEYMFKL